MTNGIYNFNLKQNRDINYGTLLSTMSSFNLPFNIHWLRIYAFIKLQLFNNYYRFCCFQNPAGYSKLEKADILEMAVNHVRQSRKQENGMSFRLLYINIFIFQ